MILPGHLSAAYLVSKFSGADLAGCLAACMFPDVVDKPLRWVFRITPNGKIPAHTLAAWGLSTLIVRWLLGDRFAGGWAMGYGSHMLADEVNAHLNPGRTYVLWPFRRYNMHQGPRGLRGSLADFTSAALLLEGVLTGFAAATWLRGRNHKANSSAIEDEP